MRVFDIGLISDEGMRREYQLLQSRAQSLADAFSRAYGQGRKPIEFRYINDGSFNAYAGEDEHAFTIEINASVPLFNVILFSRILSDPTVMPFISTDGTKANNFTVPAIIDPIDFDKRQDWTINLNPIRAFAAQTLADICSTFVVCHELGHIIAGHVEAIQSLEGTARVSELMSRASVSAETRERRQAWEYDADAMTGPLLAQTVDEFVENCAIHENSRLIFGGPKGRTAEHTLSVIIAACFAFFAYVQGVRDALEKDSSHPAPIVRAIFLKDLLYTIFEQREGFDGALFHRLLDTRIDEMIEVLVKLKIFHAPSMTDEYMDAVDLEVERLAGVALRYRPLCERWAWVSWQNVR